jgi:hypothetical protein
LKPVGGVGAVFTARKGSAERLGRIGSAYGLKLIGIIYGGFFVSPVIYKHVRFLSENNKSRRMEALLRPGSPAFRCFHFLFPMVLKKGATLHGLSLHSIKGFLLDRGDPLIDIREQGLNLFLNTGEVFLILRL